MAVLTCSALDLEGQQPVVNQQRAAFLDRVRQLRVGDPQQRGGLLEAVLLIRGQCDLRDNGQSSGSVSARSIRRQSMGVRTRCCGACNL